MLRIRITLISCILIYTMICIVPRRGYQKEARNALTRLQQSWKDVTLFSIRIPYKKDSCNVFTFNQTITKRGCNSVIIPNNLCYGLCGSFFIPQSDPFNVSGVPLYKQCRRCIPAKYQLIKLLMYCPNRRRKYRIKRILLVHSCRCYIAQCEFSHKHLMY